MQKRAIETRSKILKSATRLFAQNGMNGTSVDKIAQDAQINKQRIYAYFGSKEKLFAAVLENIFRESAPVSESMLSEAEADPENLTQILLKGFHHYHDANPSFWRLLAWANLEDARISEVLKNVRTRENEAIKKLFTQAQELEAVGNIPFEHYLFTLLALSWFMRSNALTLRHTLGFDPFAAGFLQSLSREMGALFARHTSPDRKA